MKNRICPTCKEKVKLIDIIKAPTPFHIRCSNCKAIIKLKHPFVYTVIAIIYGIILAWVIILAYGNNSVSLPLAILLTLFGIVVIEVSFSIYLNINADA